MRYERKYRAEELRLAEVVQLVRDHPLSFRRLWPDRQVNNIYFDTEDLHFFRQNLYGVPQRHKLRIRWYGKDYLQATDPVLELKCKDGLLGDKFSVSVPGFAVTGLEGSRAAMRAGVAGLWQDEGARLAAPSLMELGFSATLLNTYQRSYLTSYNGKFRLTIDWDMRSYAFNARQEPHRIFATDEAVIVEVKYDEALDDEFQLVGQRIPLRLSRNSKYVMGMLQVGNV